MFPSKKVVELGRGNRVKKQLQLFRSTKSIAVNPSSNKEEMPDVRRKGRGMEARRVIAAKKKARP